MEGSSPRAPEHSACAEATEGRPGLPRAVPRPRVSPGPAGCCLYFPRRRPAELSTNAQPLKVTVFPGAPAGLPAVRATVLAGI